MQSISETALTEQMHTAADPVSHSMIAMSMLQTFQAKLESRAELLFSLRACRDNQLSQN